MIRKSALLASAGLMAVAAPAFAQTTPPSNESGMPTTAPPTQGSTAQAGAVQNQALEQQPVDTGNIIITSDNAWLRRVAVMMMLPVSSVR